MATKLYITLMEANELQKFMEQLLPGVIQETVTEVLDEYSDKAIVETKKEFGVYQPGRPGEGGVQFDAWPGLKQITIDTKKVRKGQNVPLLDSDELKSSIEKMVIDQNTQAIGTYDPNGRRHEWGTTRAPARPWLQPVLFALKAPMALKLRQRLIEKIRAKFRPLKS